MFNALIDFFIYLNLFFTGYNFFKQPFEFNISYIPILLLLPIFIGRYRLNTKTLFIILPLLVAGFLNMLLGNDNASNFLKIFINISVNLVFYEYVMQHYEYNIEHMMRLYLKGCVIVAVYGIIQVVSYNIGFAPGYNLKLILTPINKWGLSLGGFGLRANSFLSEPSYIASALGPAAFLSLYNLFRRDIELVSTRNALLILTCYILSFSSLAFTGLFIILFLIALNSGASRYLIATIPLIIFLYFSAYNNSKEFQVRIIGLKKLFIEGVLDKKMETETNKDSYVTKREMISRRQIVKEVHGSSFILYNNYYVAKKNFMKNPLLGSGLGSHIIAFEEHDLSYLIGEIYDSNGQDANSMFLRTMSEIGVLGIGFILFFIFGYYVSKDLTENEPSHFWLFSNALLIVILIQLFRQGNYTFNGFFMYAWMYYYNCVNYREYKQEMEEKNKLKEINLDAQTLTRTN
jgi:hypothetical protein